MADEIALLEKALAAAPDNWAVRRSLAAKLRDAGRAADAGKLLQAAPEIPSAEKDQLFAAELIAGVDRPAAHTLLEKFLEENGASAQGHLLQGRLDKAGGNLAKAESHFKVAAVLDPKISVDDEMAGGEKPEAEPEAVAKAAPAEEAKPPREPEPVVVPAPVALTPRPLRPPGAAKKEEPKEVKKPVEKAVAADSEPVAVAVAADDDDSAEEAFVVAVDSDEDEGEGYFDESSGERVFIVGEGELVHAHEREADTKIKISALTVALLAHAVVLAVLGLVVIAQPRPNPPQITASSLISTDQESIETMTVKKKQRTATAVTSAQPTVTVDSFSAVAMPEVMNISDNLSMVTLSADTGFSMSMDTMSDVTNMSAIPANMQSRCSMSQRMKRLRESGGEDRAERSVRKALEFISSQQNKNGSFGKKYTVAMTGLCLLAYLGHCETPESPKFGEGVVNAALYLMEVARKQEGYMHNGEKGGNHQAYEHGIGTYALAELHTMTKESGRAIPRLETALRACVKKITDGQFREGGWAYGYGTSNPDSAQDMSVSGWQVQALKAAYNTGENFTGVDRALDKAMKYMKDIQDDNGGFKYRPDKGPGKPTLTGAALLGFQIWNEMGCKEYKKGMEFLSKSYANPSPGNNFYAPYYNTQAFFLHGGKEWEHYNGIFQKKLLDAQKADGSWPFSNTGHGQDDAQIMNTAWGALMLEVYYRYLPTTDKVEGLKPRS